MPTYTIEVLNVRELFHMFNTLCEAQWSCDHGSDSPQKLMGKSAILAISCNFIHILNILKFLLTKPL